MEQISVYCFADESYCYGMLSCLLLMSMSGYFIRYQQNLEWHQPIIVTHGLNFIDLKTTNTDSGITVVVTMVKSVQKCDNH